MAGFVGSWHHSVHKLLSFKNFVQGIGLRHVYTPYHSCLEEVKRQFQETLN